MTSAVDYKDYLQKKCLEDLFCNPMRFCGDPSRIAEINKKLYFLLENTTED